MPFDRMARLRSPLLSTAAIVAAGLLLWLGAIAFWSRVALLDPAGFSERADAALDSESVREILAGTIVDQVSALGSSRVITVRPLAVFAVSEVMESRPFRAVFRRAVYQAHASIFTESEGIVLPLVDIVVVVSGALESLDPRLAERLPAVRSTLLEFRDLSFAEDLLRVSRALRRTAWALPLLALALYGLGIWVAPDRHQALVRGALALTVVGIALLVGVVVGGTAVAATLEDAVERRAVVDLWRAYAGELARWGLAAAVFGTALSAATGAGK